MKLDLQFDEVFECPVDAVWSAITDSRLLARWLMDNDFEPRVGHKFTLRDPPTSTWGGRVACEVLELEPPRRMVWSWNAGIDDEVETRLVFELRQDGARTHLLFRHEGEGTAERVGSLDTGWSRRMRILRHVVGPDYARRVAFGAPCERAFDAISTLEGLRRWWTPRVSGSASVGGELRFDFDGVDHVVMRVDRVDAPFAVEWSCVEHSRLADWNGTRVLFGLAPRSAEGSELTFRHIGLTPSLECFGQCERGWDHFLASLVSYVERGEGTPFRGSESRR